MTPITVSTQIKRTFCEMFGANFDLPHNEITGYSLEWEAYCLQETVLVRLSYAVANENGIKHFHRWHKDFPEVSNMIITADDVKIVIDRCIASEEFAISGRTYQSGKSYCGYERIVEVMRRKLKALESFRKTL